MLAIHLQGTSSAMGEAVGRAFPLAIYRVAAERFRQYHTATCDPDRLRDALEERASEVRACLPDVHAFLAGMARGSTVPLWKLVLVNMGLGGADVAPPKDGPSPGGACTIAAFTDSPDGPLVGGNLDDPQWQFLGIESPDLGYRCVQVRLPGYAVTWGGMNEHGLCVTGASGGPAIASTADAEPGPATPRIRWSPVQELLHHCRSTAEAIDLIASPRFEGNNYMVGDVDSVVQVEKRYDGVTVHVFRGPEDAPLCGGNLRRTDAVLPWYSRHLKTLPQDKLARHRLVAERMTAVAHTPSIAALKSVLTAHGQSAEDVTRSHGLCHVGSALSLIGVPRSRRLLVAEAPACINGYCEYDLNELL